MRHSLLGEGPSNHVHDTTAIVDIHWRVERIWVFVHFGLTAAHCPFKRFRLLPLVSQVLHEYSTVCSLVCPF